MGSQGTVLLQSITLAVSAEVITQRGHACVREPERQAGEEPTLLAVDTAAVHEDNRLVGCLVRDNQRADQMQAVKGTKTNYLLDGHNAPGAERSAPPSSQLSGCSTYGTC
jgi:hypothetical protein